LKCGLLTSFGFGQVGGIALIIHPDYLIGSLTPKQFSEYKSKIDGRTRTSYRKFNDMFTKGNLIVLKDAPPFNDDQEVPVLLNPLARTVQNADGSWSFPKVFPGSVPNHAVPVDKLFKEVTSDGIHGVGTDVEMISAIPVDNETFVERNFTEGEKEYCKKSADPRAS
jgi:hypothetical protein